jgi:hypothetical protein
MEPFRAPRSTSRKLSFSRQVRCLAVLALCSVVGCADTGEGDVQANTPAPAGPGKTAAPLEGCDAIDLAPPKPGQGAQVSLELPLGPGEERQVCKLVLLDNAVNLNWSEGIYTKGSHHGLTARTMYRDALPTENIRGDAVDASRVATCESLGSDWNVLSVIADGHAAGSSPRTALNSRGTLPDDVALKIEANEVLLMNFHMINVTDHPVRACYKQNLYSIPDEQVKREAGQMFYYNSFVTIPARQHATSTMACPVSHDVTLGSQVSHMHKRGIDYTATLLDRDPLEGGQEMKTLYEGTTWDEPLVEINAPALELKAGQWIKWACTYENLEDSNVAQGQETTDEMCMFLGMYWPRSPEMDWCMAPGSTESYSASRLLANGSMNGAQFLDCWSNSPQIIGGGGPKSAADRYTSQRCFTDSCAKVSARVNEFGSGKLDPSTVTCD